MRYEYDELVERVDCCDTCKFGIEDYDNVWYCLKRPETDEPEPKMSYEYEYVKPSNICSQFIRE